MRYFVSLLVAVFLSMSTVHEALFAQNEEIIKNPLTLELSFGADDEKLPAEYLLVNPSFLAVNNNGDIIVPDEYFLKIYDGEGNPKSMLGGQGEGPGEFSRSPRSVFISRTGYITSIASGANVYQRYNFYDPAYEFIEQVNIQYSDAHATFKEEYPRDRNRFYEIYYYSQENILYRGYGSDRSASTVGGSGRGGRATAGSGTADSGAGPGAQPRPAVSALLYQNSQSIQVILTEENYNKDDSGNSIQSEESGIRFGLLDDRRFAYTHAAKDKSFENNTHYYSLFVYNFADGQKTEIKQQYSQIAFPDSVIYFRIDRSESLDDLRAINPAAAEQLENMQKTLDENRTKRLEEVEYYSGVRDLLTDGDFIFIFTYEWIENEGHVVHVIDSRTGIRVNITYFPFIPVSNTEPMVIKNGYAYRLTKNIDGFKIVQKYKIDPKVYGK